MKFLAFLLIPIISFSQTKKDFKIIVNVADTTNLFNRVSLAFIEQGYVVETRQPDIGFMATGARTFKGMTAASSMFKALIKDSTVTFTGMVRIDVNFMGSPDTFSPIHYTAKGSMHRKVWDEMLLIAQKFGNRISYAP